MRFVDSLEEEVFRKHYYTYPVFVGILTILVYLPALRNDFVNWDDYVYVTKNSNIFSIDSKFFRWAFFEFYSSNWHPFAWVSHAIDYALWGLNPAGHHFTSILLHGANASLVSVLCIKFLSVHRSAAGGIISSKGVIYAACFTGFLFGVHPLHVESAAWISERKDLLCAFFYLFSLICYAGYVQALIGEGIKKNLLMDRMYLSSLFLFVCALFSKPMAITLPAVLFLLDWYPFQRLKNRLSLREKIPFLIFSLSMTITALLAQMWGGSVKSVDSFPISSRVVIGVDSVFVYLQKMIFPARLINFYSIPKNVSFEFFLYWSSLLAVGMLTVWLLSSAKKYKAFFVVWFYYLVTLLPVLGFVKIGGQAMADRYTYLPSISLFLFVTTAGVMFYERGLKENKNKALLRLAAGCVIVAVGMALVSLTVKQIGVWSDSISLWSHTIRLTSTERDDYYRRSARAHIGLASAYHLNGMPDMAIAELQSALAIEPNETNARMFLGDIYISVKRPEDAAREFEKIIEINPQSEDVPLTVVKLSLALRRAGRPAEAEEVMRIAEKRMKNP
ncbi:MAG: tetratricopeptide repeat protein [Nitrospirae bacterium]|nr:MAG: tetratricopeptide repeat protein [Nitrospirota bacterium]